MLLLSFASLNWFIFILGQCKNQDMPFGECKSTCILTATFQTGRRMCHIMFPTAFIKVGHVLLTLFWKWVLPSPLACNRKEMSWHLNELGMQVNLAWPDHLLYEQSYKGKCR